MRIGIDFDNTLINYDRAFLETAHAWGLVEPHFSGGKRAVRDAIRLRPQGELDWQRLQGRVYGNGIAQAELFPGAGAFLKRCRRDGHEVCIISHKTLHGHYDPRAVNLHDAALGWMEAQGFFLPDGLGVPRKRVFFEPTREAKLARIALQDCRVFIDDLEEVLGAPGFPPGVKRILFAASDPFALGTACPTWPHVEAALFDHRD